MFQLPTPLKVTIVQVALALLKTQRRRIMTNLATKIISNYSIKAVHIQLHECEFGFNKYGKEGNYILYEVDAERMDGCVVFYGMTFVPLADHSNLLDTNKLDAFDIVTAINKKHNLWDTPSEVIEKHFDSENPVDIIKVIASARNSKLRMPNLLTLKLNIEGVSLDSIATLKDRLDFDVRVRH